MLIIISISLVVISCKKNTPENIAANNSSRKLLKLNDDKTISPYLGECSSNLGDSLRKWINKYGYDGPNVSQERKDESIDKYNDIFTEASSCNGGANGNNPGPTMPAFVQPPIFEEFKIDNIQKLLAHIGVPNLCDQNSVNGAKLVIAPLNLIIKRFVDAHMDTDAYYSNMLSPAERFRGIISVMLPTESYLFDDEHFPLTYGYFMVVSELSINIPEIVAVTLFEKDPLQVGTNQFYHWNGFIIDSSLNNLNHYCPSPILLPNPLPENIYFQSQYNLLGQFLPHFGTTIILNSQNNKYYIDSSFSQFVPDGYYDSPSEILLNNHRYYHIINGIVVEILNIYVDPNGPTQAPQ